MMVNCNYYGSQSLEHELRHRIDYILNKAFEEKEYDFILHILSQLELHEHKMECTKRPEEVMFNQEE
ncbi:hypothetical protein HNP85_000412 [Methanococcus maripaludis]|uniref:Uncharacterized protein n=1 Tax=Methanococcus maripaludis TaxID=39152 RepID=A0A8T4CJ84_METMI|nr:hypothetical protein [Methanococcus maripaludis]MBP2219091.1 hypothetical protein [Methanococcus maripaludis]